MDIFKPTGFLFFVTLLEHLTSGEDELLLNAAKNFRRVRVNEVVQLKERQRRHALVEDNLEALESYIQPFHNRQKRFIDNWEDFGNRATTESTTKPTTPSSPPPPPQTNPPTTTTTTTAAATTTPAPTTKAPIKWKDIFKIPLPRFPVIKLPWGRRLKRW